ncbi:MAG: hypothetical protein JWR05_429 [Mucilaginibacter sp.]|nr:hypothetical protein [Mucilaginibacter sp.]
MSLHTITALSVRLKAYCDATGVDYIHIIFHGGEPLLLSQDYFIDCIEILKSTSSDIKFSFSVQTNGVTINKEWYDLFKANNVKVGISLDGPKKHHDEFRLFHNGKGSYDEVAQAIRIGNGNGLAGILMVINTNIPTREFYQEIKELNVGKLNLLFPDGHYDRLPNGFDGLKFGDDNYTPYADWLIELFLIWKSDRLRPIIRLFETLIEMVAGIDGIGNQGFGRTKNGVVVIETDGGIEVTDSLRACYEGITRNGINVHTSNIEDLFKDDIFEVYYHAHDMVCEQCLNCPVYDFCGGGFLGNRFANHNGFNNPTIYCRDMIRLISFIQNDFLQSLPLDAINSLKGVQKLSYADVIEDISKPFLVKIDDDVKQKLISFKQPVLI